MNEHTSLHFAQGPTLIKVINDHYRTILSMLLELVQNCMDENATDIRVVLNRKTGNIAVSDNGDGASTEKFARALGQVMKSMKTPDKFGQFGEGMLSHLGKCDHALFISCAKDSDRYMEWRFETAEIAKQMDEIVIPQKERPDYRYNPGGTQKAIRGVTFVQWRTRVEVHNFTRDRFIGKIPSATVLFEQIVEQYRQRMLENNVFVSVKLVDESGKSDEYEGKASPYSGKPLQVMRNSHRTFGTAAFTLFLAADAVGKVTVGQADNPFRFSFRQFAKSHSGLLLPDAVEALNSGIFEGDFVCSGIELHPNRKSFVENDALVFFCESIEKWYREVGEKNYGEAVSAESDKLYDELGRDLKRNMHALLRRPEFAELLRAMKDGVPGLAASSSSYAGMPGPGTSDPAVSKDGGGSGGGGGGSGKKSEPKQGTKSNTVVGFEVRYDGMLESRELWMFDGTNAVLYINRRHPRWKACEHSQRLLKQMQEFIAIKALVLHSCPQEMHSDLRLYADGLMDPFICLIQNSPSFWPSKKAGDTGL